MGAFSVQQYEGSISPSKDRLKARVLTPKDGIINKSPPFIGGPWHKTASRGHVGRLGSPPIPEKPAQSARTSLTRYHSLCARATGASLVP